MANELNAEMEATVEEIVEGFYPSGPIDWHDFLDRFEDYADIDLGNDMMSPVIRAIKRHAKAHQKL